MISEKMSQNLLIITFLALFYNIEADPPGSPCRYDEYKCISGDQCKSTTKTI